MSIEAMSAVLHHCVNTSPAAKLVLLGIANHQGDQGAYPSIETLAKYACVSSRSVSRYIQDLKMKGYVEVHEQAGRGGTNLYWVTVMCPEECDRSTNHRLRGMTAVSYPMTNQVVGHDSSVVPPMTTVSYKPSYNLNKTITKMSEKEIAEQRAMRMLQADAISAASARAKAEAVDSPTCEHDKKLIFCDVCCAALATGK